VLLREEVLGDALPRVVERIVARAVRDHALGASIDGWARRWRSGEERSARAEWAAARAAAEWAAARAARAARAAGEAERERQLADILAEAT
jgi:hypothetical protein